MIKNSSFLEVFWIQLLSFEPLKPLRLFIAEIRGKNINFKLNRFKREKDHQP